MDGAELPAGTYYIRILMGSGTNYDGDIYYDGDAGYTDGKAFIYNTDGVEDHDSGSIVDSTADLYFKVMGAIPLGFDSSVTVQANCTESSKTATLTNLTLLPADTFCAVYEREFLANQGVLIEATDPIAPPAAYLTASTAGTAGPAVAPVVYHGTPRLPVGVNRVVTACDGDVTISGEWMPCYSNAAAGSL